MNQTDQGFMLENIQVIDRAWPAPKSLTREAYADEITRDQMFRQWNWIRDETDDSLRDILSHTVHILWRDKSLKSDEERVAEIRAYIVGFIELWAENKVEACDE